MIIPSMIRQHDGIDHRNAEAGNQIVKSRGVPDSAEQDGALPLDPRRAPALARRDVNQIAGLEENSDRFGQPAAGSADRFPYRADLGLLVRPRQE
jgi:hypothetical protein